VSGAGKKGRYSRTFSPEIVYEARGLHPSVAWASEQKLLQCLPRLPWEQNLLDWVWYWNKHEDLMLETDGDYLKVREIIDKERAVLMKKKPEVLRDCIVKAKSDRLGETEWRDWRGSASELVEAAECIVRFSRDFLAS